MFRPSARIPAAMLVWPAIRSAPIARLRRATITRGALLARICERSSSNVTSLTQWTRCSILWVPKMCRSPVQREEPLMRGHDLMGVMECATQFMYRLDP
jgi:hypothetical protein